MLFYLILSVSLDSLHGDDSNFREAVEPLAEEYDSEGATALVETDPGYYNTYYTDPAYSQYYHRSDHDS